MVVHFVLTRPHLAMKDLLHLSESMQQSGYSCICIRLTFWVSGTASESGQKVHALSSAQCLPVAGKK